MFAILFLTKLLPFFGNGPLWFQVREEIGGCSDYWWTNLLYISNLYTDHEVRKYLYILAIIRQRVNKTTTKQNETK